MQNSLERIFITNVIYEEYEHCFNMIVVFIEVFLYVVIIKVFDRD